MPESVHPGVGQPDAHALLRRAHAAAYRYPDGFGGFRADLIYRDDERGLSGAVEARSPSEISVELLEASDEQRAWVRDVLASEMGHRWPTHYEERDGRYTLTVESRLEHPLGHLLRFHDDRFRSTYCVSDDAITVVDRTIGGHRFNIVMQAWIRTEDGRRLPAQYTVAFWDVETGRLERVEIYSSEYVLASGVYLLARRRVVTVDDRGLRVRQLELRDHALLPAQALA
ncbi:hypothetical protein HRbin26_02369 [bacterium HR26]|nr:hypothetical protein HRbin26_02369 [bacterium HR26]